MASKKKALGRGLGALLDKSARKREIEPEPVSVDFESSNLPGEQSLESDQIPVLETGSAVNNDLSQVAEPPDAKDHIKRIPIEFLQPGRYQPRKQFDQESLDELAQSISSQGMMQPIVVRAIDNHKYEIIAGERRWRASQIAGLDRVPCILKDVTDEHALAMALVENIQREDLNPVEESEALKQMQMQFELTQQEIADIVGKSRAVVANLLRIGDLEQEVLQYLREGLLDLGHAKVLLALKEKEQKNAAEIVVAKKLTVRQTEQLIKKIQSGESSNGVQKGSDPDVLKLEESLSKRVGAPVQIKGSSNGKGRLVVSYSSLDQLDGIIALLSPQGDLDKI